MFFLISTALGIWAILTFFNNHTTLNPNEGGNPSSENKALKFKFNNKEQWETVVRKEMTEWGGDWNETKHTVTFQNDSDATAFLLRWS